MINCVILDKPKNIGKIDNLKSLYEDRYQVYYRGLSYAHFYYTKTNGLKEERNWLVFSETSKCVYCYPCKIFSKISRNSLAVFETGKLFLNLCQIMNFQKSICHPCVFYTEDFQI